MEDTRKAQTDKETLDRKAPQTEPDYDDEETKKPLDPNQNKA